MTTTKGKYWLADTAVLADPKTCRHMVPSNWRLGEFHDQWKVVECKGERDTLQCLLCGSTKKTSCDFDENYS